MRRIFIAAFLLVAPLVLWTMPARADDPEARAARLGRNIRTTSAPHKGTSVQWGQAVGVVEAPVDSVAGVVENYQSYRKFLPHFKKSRILSKRGANALVYLEADVVSGTVTLWAQMKIYRRASSGPTRVVEGRMVDGNMDTFIARWNLTPLDGGERTLVRFELLVDPDLPLPSSVFSKENRKSARRTIKALRERVQASSR